MIKTGEVSFDWVILHPGQAQKRINEIAVRERGFTEAETLYVRMIEHVRAELQKIQVFSSSPESKLHSAEIGAIFQIVTDALEKLEELK